MGFLSKTGFISKNGDYIGVVLESNYFHQSAIKEQLNHMGGFGSKVDSLIKVFSLIKVVSWEGHYVKKGQYCEVL